MSLAIRASIASVLVVSALAPVSLAHAVDDPCIIVETIVTCTFDPGSGTTLQWTVPDDVTSATFDLYGAAGGGGGTIAGRGAHVTATLALSPGTTYDLNLGGVGSTEGGGYNGGGRSAGDSYGGGGATDLRPAGAGLEARLLVAGGGGGAGAGRLQTLCSDGACNGALGKGGDSGSAGTAGTVGGSAPAGQGGQPGSSAGGVGGHSGFWLGTTTPDPAQGGAGDLGIGGIGGEASAAAPPGGGGGGGWYGGGGGGTGAAIAPDTGGGGGGGGGSSYVVTTATNPSVTQGANAEDGRVVISYAAPDTTPTDTTPPTVTVNEGSTQNDPTQTSPITFDVVFSEGVTGFVDSDVTLSGTAGATTAQVSGSGTTYTVAVSGMTQPGTVIATVPTGAAIDAANNDSVASSSTDNTVTYAPDAESPSVTVNQALLQADPTASGPILFTVAFSETVTGFAGSDVTLSGTAGATTAQVSGTGATYTVSVSGMTQPGTVIATVPADAASDAAANTSTASTSTDNTVTYDPDVTRPRVTVNQASTQADPTRTSPIVFTVLFDEPVTGFTDSDVTLSGTGGATSAQVSGSGATYTVAVSGMTASGTVRASLPEGVASDATGNTSRTSTSTDNTVVYDVTAPSLSCTTTPAKWTKPPNHKLIDVSVTITATDANGAPTIQLLSFASSQADAGLGPDDVPNDMVGWSVTTDDRSGSVRAERYKIDRVYTLIYKATDRAGNTVFCSPTVTITLGAKR
ncbi:MAG TPA: glycine-rich protein [Nocardioidaceae bacterium]|nr:glycine-rich protein [Nocardioidaceae bacterium]